jgi:5-(carboxyamino)imidazole ribonucleotide synthase
MSAPAGAPRLGIIGDGQLAQMTVLAAVPLGVRCTVVGQPGSPAGLVAPVVPTVEDLEVDVITLENEFVPAGSLAEAPAVVRPSPATLAVIQDKGDQKQRLADKGVPVPPFTLVMAADGLPAAADQLGWPLVLKARRGGYDGYGTATCAHLAEAEEAFARFAGADGGDGVLAEAFVPFTRELSVLVVRSATGAEATYPVLESVQREHQCAEVIVPAPGDAGDAVAVALAAAAAVDGCGITAVELFQLHDGRCIVNELAPRPHNSGHVTIEACATSQFEQHVRAVLGWPLGPTTLVAPGVMVNVVGREDRPAAFATADALAVVPTAHIHLYGKADERARRKLGHVTVVHPDVEVARRQAQRAAAALLGGAGGAG